MLALTAGSTGCAVTGRFTDGIKPTGQREPIQGPQVQIEQQADPLLQKVPGQDEGFVNGCLIALRLRWIRDVPVRGDRRTGPRGANLAGHLVTHGDHEIHHRGTWCRELRPALAAQPVDGKINGLKHIQRLGVDETFGLTSGAVAMKAIATKVMDGRLGQNAARLVAGAHEQYVVVTLHEDAPIKPAVIHTNACCR